jgi:NADH oxidase (H2O2-forming)
METSVENIYAAGDCIEFVNFTGLPQKSFTEPLASREGEVAGINASGGTKYLLPLLIPYVMAFDTIQFGWVGITPITRAKELGIETIAGFGESNGRPGHIPEMELTRCLLIFDKNSDKLIGAEAVGGKNIKWRIDLLSLAIREGFTPEKILNMDLSFKPFASLIEEPLFLAAEDALQKM